MARQKISISGDFDSLFKYEIFKILDQEIKIYPLDIEQIAYVIKKANSIMPEIQKHDITWDNYSQPDKLISLVQIVLDNVPEVLSEMSGIEIDSIKKLPFEKVVEIFAISLSVNFEAKDDLAKNFKTLMEKVQEILPKEEKKKKK